MNTEDYIQLKKIFLKLKQICNYTLKILTEENQYEDTF